MAADYTASKTCWHLLSSHMTTEFRSCSLSVARPENRAPAGRTRARTRVEREIPMLETRPLRFPRKDTVGSCYPSAFSFNSGEQVLQVLRPLVMANFGPLEAWSSAKLAACIRSHPGLLNRISMQDTVHWANLSPPNLAVLLWQNWHSIKVYGWVHVEVSVQ